MATEDTFLAAIEIGSSKVTGLAAKKQPDGAIQILAFAQEPSTTFIRKGCINNVNLMTLCIGNIKEKMEKKMQRSISHFYVTIGGRGMHTVANTVIRNFDSKVEITKTMIEDMCKENLASANADLEILESVPQEYRLGTQLQTDPVGIRTETIEGRFLNIVTSSNVRVDIRDCFNNARVRIAELPINILSLADVMLSESEKRSGCAFVDMGAETTSVAVYKNNILRHLAVIPLGGANINRDIMSLQVEDDEAEELKLKYGTAVAGNSEDTQTSITLRDGRTVTHEEFSGLVEARVEEIILNVNNQIALSKYNKENLIGGLVITGGASHMKDIDKAFMRDTGFEKIRFVRKARFTLRGPDTHDFNKDGDYNALLALVDKGGQNCCGGPLGNPDLFKEPVKPTPPEPTPEELKRKAEEEAEEKARLDRLRKEQEGKERRKKRWATVKNVFNNIGSWLEKSVSDKD